MIGLTFAIAIGATTALFSVLDAILIRSLPVTSPHELFFLADAPRNRDLDGALGVGTTTWFALREYETFKEQNSTFEDLAAFRGADRLSISYSGAVSPRTVGGLLVSANYFQTLGVRPHLGRSFSESEAASRETVAVISHRYWQNTFGDSPDPVGATLEINDVPFAVVGILPPDFFGVVPGEWPDIFIPLSTAALVTPSLDLNVSGVQVVGRLAPEGTETEAQAELATTFDGIRQDRIANAPPNTPLTTDALAERSFALQAAAQGLGLHRDTLQRPILAISLVVLLISLLACGSVSVLLLARNSVRRKELATRLVLGATRGSMTRMLVLEGLLLAFAGGSVGLAFAYWCLALIVPLMASGLNPLEFSVNIDGRSLLVACVASIIAAGVSSVLPLFQITGARAREALARGAETPGRSVRRDSRILLGSQVALSLISVVAAGVFIRSLHELRTVDLGFNESGLLLASMDPTLVGYDGDRLTRFYRDLHEGVAALPEVEDVTMSAFAPMGGVLAITMATVPGYVPVPGTEDGPVRINKVGPGYFATLEIPLLAGRDFDRTDVGTEPRVAVVNRAFSERYFSGRDPIGAPVTAGFMAGAQEFVIVGVSENSKARVVPEEASPTMYTAAFQDSRLGAMTLEIRAAAARTPGSIAGSIRSEIMRADPRLAVFDVRTAEEQVEESLAQNRIVALVAGILGGLGVAIVFLGAYGLFSHDLKVRSREIGIRQAMGASPRHIVWGVVGEAFFVAGVGGGVALLAALALRRWIGSLVFNTDSADPMVVMGSLSAVALAVFLGSVVPARHASSVSPVSLIRENESSF
jgi:predicted permease